MVETTEEVSSGLKKISPENPIRLFRDDFPFSDEVEKYLKENFPGSYAVFYPFPHDWRSELLDIFSPVGPEHYIGKVGFEAFKMSHPPKKDIISKL